MKAIQYHSHGGRDVLALEDIPDPGDPPPGEVRVRVIAASVNPVDGKVRRGELKLIAGLGFPKRPGLDFAGVVEAVGHGVEGWKEGDAVYGGARSMSDGAFAEHIHARPRSIARPPRSLDAVTRAGVPTVAMAALQTVRDVLHAGPGMRVLVNGCTGGVGLYAIQAAKQAGATVVGVCSTDGVALARAFGADEVVDYRQSRVDVANGRFGGILELSGHLSFDAARELLDHGGVYVDFSPSPAALIGNTVANAFREHRHAFAMTAAKTADLDLVADRLDCGAWRPAPTRVFPLEQFAEAFAVAEGGGTIGKIVVRIWPDA